MKTHVLDLLTYVNADISFRGAIASRSLPGGIAAVKMKSSLWDRQLLHGDMSSQAQESSHVLSSRSALKGGAQQPTNRRHLSGHDPCECMASSEEVRVCNLTEGHGH